MEITKRAFLKLGAIGGLGASLPGCAKKIVLKPKEKPWTPKGDEKYVSTVCGMCPAGCGLRVRKIGPYAVGLSGHLDHPVNQGGLCPKGAAGLQELYHPDRLRGPLLVQGPRGKNNWQAISWDEAFGLIVDKVKKAKTRKAKKTLGIITASKSQDLGQDLLKDLTQSYGENNEFVLGFPPSDPPYEGYRETHGNQDVFLDLTKPRLLVSFSFDWLQSHTSPVEAQRAYAELRHGLNRERGHIVQIEPRFSVTAAKADEWIALKPGTEGVLALAVAKQLIQNETYDKNFVENHTHGFEEFKKSLEILSFEEASEITGVSQEKIRLLALKFLSLKPAAAIASRGTVFNQMAVHALNALVGSIGPGQPFLTGIPAMGSSLSFPFSAEKGKERLDPIAVILVDRANPVFLEPLKWRPIFEKAPFVMTVSSQLSETALLSDLILPCHTPLEQMHLSRHILMEGKTIINASTAAVQPLYDTKDPAEIYLRLKLSLSGEKIKPDAFASYFKAHLQKLGMEKPLNEESEGLFVSQARSVGETLIFSTPSRKFEFGALSKTLRQASFTQESSLKKDFPLTLYLFAPIAFLHGEGAHLPYLLGIAGASVGEMWDTWVELHPDTAKIWNVSDGQVVGIESPQGKIKAKARVLPSAQPGVLSLPVGLGHTAYGRWAKGLGSNPLEIASMNQPTWVRISKL